MRGTPDPASGQLPDRVSSHRFFADLFRTDADRVFHWKNENFPSPILPVLAARTTSLTAFSTTVSEYDFHFHFGENPRYRCRDNRCGFLTAEPLDFGDGHPFNSQFGECLFDLFEFERFDDRFQFFVGVTGVASCFAIESERGTRS
jgi:hypothetical protein